MRRSLFALRHPLADDAAHRRELDRLFDFRRPAGAAASVPAARTTSSARTAPSGPLPLRDARSIPLSLAILLAAGDAGTRVRARGEVSEARKSPFDPPLAKGEIGGFGSDLGLLSEFWVEGSGRDSDWDSIRG